LLCVELDTFDVVFKSMGRQIAEKLLVYVAKEIIARARETWSREWVWPDLQCFCPASIPPRPVGRSAFTAHIWENGLALGG